MNFLTHLLFGFFLAKLLQLEGMLFALAILFSILPDFDHLFRVGDYVHENHMHFVKEWPWRTSLQEPIGVLWTLPVSLWVGSVVPTVFFLGHLLLDYTMHYAKQPFAPFSDYKLYGMYPENGKFELAIAGLLLAGNFFLVLA